MSVNRELTENRPAVDGLLCTTCGDGSVPLSAANQCSRCEAAAARRQAAADEFRAWKRYSPGQFR